MAGRHGVGQVSDTRSATSYDERQNNVCTTILLLLVLTPESNVRCSLELGAGGGLVGLALALALNQDRGSTASANPAVSIHMTDQASMIPLMRRNIELNRLSAGQISAGILDWGTANDDQRYDVILAAECVYFEPAFPLLLKTMKHYIGKDTVCYFCFKKRRKADLRFMKEAKKMFRVEDVADDPDKEIWSRENLFM